MFLPIQLPQVSIMNAVQNSVGFAAMDSMLLRTLETWFRDQQRSIAAAAAASTASTAEANAYYSLAMQHWHTGDAAQGEAAARKALAIRMRFYGPLHIETLAAKGVLGILLRMGKKFQECRQVCVEVVEGRTQTLGANHSETITASSNLAACLYEMGAHHEAHAILLKVVPVLKRDLG